jgi:hypothetical protein
MLFISNALISLILPLFNFAYGNEGKIFPPDRVLFWKNAIALPVTIASVYTAALAIVLKIISSPIERRSCTYYFFCMSIFDSVFLATLLRALSQIVASKYIEECGFYSALRHAIVPKFVIDFVCWLLSTRSTNTKSGEFVQILRDKDDTDSGDYWDPDDNFTDYFGYLTLLPYAVYFTVTTFTITLGVLSYPSFHVSILMLMLALASSFSLPLCASSCSLQAVYLLENMFRFLLFLPPLLGIFHLALWKSSVLGLNSIKDPGYRMAELFMGSTAVGAQALSAGSSKQSYRTKMKLRNQMRAAAAKRLDAAGFTKVSSYAGLPLELDDMLPEANGRVAKTVQAVRDLTATTCKEAWLQMALSVNSYAATLSYMHDSFGYSRRNQDKRTAASRQINTGMPKPLRNLLVKFLVKKLHLPVPVVAVMMALVMWPVLTIGSVALGGVAFVLLLIFMVFLLVLPMVYFTPGGNVVLAIVLHIPWFILRYTLLRIIFTREELEDYQDKWVTWVAETLYFDWSRKFQTQAQASSDTVKAELITSLSLPALTIEVQIPIDKEPGSQLMVAAPDGRQVQIVVPEGVVPGQSRIQVNVPMVGSTRKCGVIALENSCASKILLVCIGLLAGLLGTLVAIFVDLLLFFWGTTLLVTLPLVLPLAVLWQGRVVKVGDSKSKHAFAHSAGQDPVRIQCGTVEMKAKMVTACWEDQLVEEAIGSALGNTEQIRVLAKRCIVVLDNGLEQRSYLLEPTANAGDRSMVVLNEEDFIFPSTKSEELESTNPLVAASLDCDKHALWHYVRWYWTLLKHVLCKRKKKQWQKHPFFLCCTDDGISAYNAEDAVNAFCATHDAGSTFAARKERKEVLRGEKEESTLQSSVTAVPQESLREREPNAEGGQHVDQNILRHVCAVEDSKFEANEGCSSFEFLKQPEFDSSALQSRNNPARVTKIKVSHDVPLRDINVRPYLYVKRAENEDERDADQLVEALVIPIMKRTKSGTRLWFRRIAVPDVLVDFSIWTKKKISQNRDQGVLTHWGARELQLAAIFDRYTSALVISSTACIDRSKLRKHVDLCVSAAKIMKCLLYDHMEEWDGRQPESYMSNVARFQREQPGSYISPLAQLGVVSVSGDVSLSMYEAMWNRGSSKLICHACRLVSSEVTTTLSAFGYRVGNNLGGNTCESQKLVIRLVWFCILIYVT